jgi:hypothetical protein
VSERVRVTVVNPLHPHFMVTGTLMVDGREWSMVDIGFAEPVPIETDALMSEAQVNALIRRLVTNYFWQRYSAAPQTSTKV